MLFWGDCSYNFEINLIYYYQLMLKCINIYIAVLLDFLDPSGSFTSVYFVPNRFYSVLYFFISTSLRSHFKYREGILTKYQNNSQA
jgi:L-asparagine transporter-like permease